MTQYYAVWFGRKTGIYDNWNDCKSQVDKFPGAKFRKLKNTEYATAVQEFNDEKGVDLPKIQISHSSAKTVSDNSLIETKSLKISPTLDIKGELPIFNDKQPIEGVLTVDGASNGENCEFQAVWYPSGEHVFKSKKYNGGTNNIAEFLGIVFALKYLMKNKLPLNVYSDSVTAMAWYRNKKANTTANETGKGTEELNTLIKDAEDFLKKNANELNKAHIMKWHTGKWGEIPADFGRKGTSKKPKM